jgi:hypothetical protein
MVGAAQLDRILNRRRLAGSFCADFAGAWGKMLSTWLGVTGWWRGLTMEIFLSLDFIGQDRNFRGSLS